MKIRIVFQAAPGSTAPPRGEEIVEIGTHPIVIGSEHTNQIRIEGKNIQVRHANLRIKNGILSIMDLSGRGIFVNGVEQRSRSDINFGSMIQICDVAFHIEEVVEDATSAVEEEEIPAPTAGAASPPPPPRRSTGAVDPGAATIAPSAEPAVAPDAPSATVSSSDASFASGTSPAAAARPDPTLPSRSVMVKDTTPVPAPSPPLPAPAPPAPSPSASPPRVTTLAGVGASSPAPAPTVKMAAVKEPRWPMIVMVISLLPIVGVVVHHTLYHRHTPTTTKPSPPLITKPQRTRLCRPACAIRADCKQVNRAQFPIASREWQEAKDYDCSEGIIKKNPDGTEDRTDCQWCWWSDKPIK